jgi:hypothetical protein
MGLLVSCPCSVSWECLFHDATNLWHIGIGRTHAGTCVILLIHDLHIRVVNAATGELLRELVLDPTRDYQPNRAPKGPTRRPTK